jgi:hypothetical protein
VAAIALVIAGILYLVARRGRGRGAGPDPDATMQQPAIPPDAE